MGRDRAQGSIVTRNELFQQAVQAHTRGDRAQAERLYRAVLAGQPDHARALANLGLLLADRGDTAAAVACHEASIRSDSRLGTTHCNLGQVLRAAKRWEEAAASYYRALALQPEMEIASVGLSLALIALNRPGAAAEVIGQALANPPQEPTGRAALYSNRGVIRRNQGLLDQAEADYRAALQLAPNMAMVWNNLAELCFDTGRVEEGLAHNQKARELAPDEPLFASNRLFHLDFLPGCDAPAIRGEVAAWRARFADPLRAEIRPHRNDRSPERRLRVGYVSPNFRDHCQALYTLPLLAHHDPSQIEVFCYADVPVPDAITARIRERAHGWRDSTYLTHEQLAELIRADQIDILVDLTMHMSGSRLQVFARKPAPVQVAWLAYPGTTGLDTIDYRLTDPYLDPPGTDESLYAEKTWRLPSSFWCYQPLDADLPDPGPLPALANGHVTFGCLNRSLKINEGVLKVWARILAATRASRLLLLAEEGACRERVLQVLARHGVARERVQFEPRQGRRSYLKLYQQMDLGLDAFPSNGHTTSLDSYFMGVPVVTLVGQTLVGRAGLSQLTNLGLPELIGRTEEEFVAIAVRVAGNLEGLSKIRAGLRQRMEHSPLMDAAAFARGVESAFRGMWRRWCASGGAG
jgi:protein O-GlcNAc transferase